MLGYTNYEVGDISGLLHLPCINAQECRLLINFRLAQGEISWAHSWRLQGENMQDFAGCVEAIERGSLSW